MSSRKLDAIVFMGVGILLLMSIRPLETTLANADSRVLAGINFLSLPGVVLLLLGVYRFATKGKT